ncbi:MAG TPA: hypothetical protein VMU64_02790 [Acidimicrobiales bacterium]|nr:hypothetical protein [Acidimicrobiales bacterium]
MRIAAVILGVALFGGLVVLAIAGVTAATAVIITAGAVVLMIGLGNAVGGRHTPNRSPYPTQDSATDVTDTGVTDAGSGGAGEAEDAGR